MFWLKTYFLKEKHSITFIRPRFGFIVQMRCLVHVSQFYSSTKSWLYYFFNQKVSFPKGLRFFIDSYIRTVDKLHKNTEFSYKSYKKISPWVPKKERNATLPRFRMIWRHIFWCYQTFKIMSD